MLTSSYNHVIDAKNRIFIPAKFREKIGDEVVVSQSVREACLVVRSEAEWEKYLEPIKKLDRSGSELILRVMNGTSVSGTYDSAGRVQLTTELIDYANLKDKQVVIVGCGDYAEIWNQEDYNKMMINQNGKSLKNILERYGL